MSVPSRRTSVNCTRTTPQLSTVAARSSASTSVVSFQPDTATRPSRASIATATASGQRDDRRLHDVGARHRRGAEDDALGAEVAVALRVLERADAPAHLDRDADRRDHRADRVRLRQAVDRRVEVHEVDPLGALRLPAPRHLGGVHPVEGLLAGAALPQAHHATLAHVDGGDDDHAALRAASTTRTKLSTMRSPTSWLFSGWNWTPRTLPRPTIAAKSRP